MACINSLDKFIICPPHDARYDDCPPTSRRSHEFDPHNPPESRFKPDPRPPLPCTSRCFACRPGPLLKKPMVANLKVRQLGDAYACRLSDGCHNRRKVFYSRWQINLDGRPRMPNMDYSEYCCDKYVDMGVNNDFYKYDTHLPLRKGPRTEALESFLWMKNFKEVNAEVKGPGFECVPHGHYRVYQPPSLKDPQALSLNKGFRLYHEDGISRWNEMIFRPEYKNFVEGATLFNSRMRPHHRDTSFSTPVESMILSRGNDSPMKELRAVKLSM